MSEFKDHVQGMVLVLVITLWATTAVFAATQGEPMLYLVEFQANEAGAPTTPEQAAELLEQLVIPSLASLSTDESIRDGGLLVGARARVFIVAAQSHDEVTKEESGPADPRGKTVRLKDVSTLSFMMAPGLRIRPCALI